MTPPLLLSLTHHKLHAHTSDLTPASIPNSTPTAIAASSTYLAEGSQSGSLTLRDPFTLQPIHQLPSHTSSVTALAISISHLSVGHADGTVSLHNLSSHDHTSFTETSPIVSLSYPSTVRHLAAATASSIALFSTVSNRLITRLTQPPTRSYQRLLNAQARFTAIAFSPIHQSLLAATDDTGCLTVYDISTILSSSRTHPVKSTPTPSSPYSRFPSALRAPTTDLSFAPDGHLAISGFDKLVRIFNPSLKQLLCTVALPSPISSIFYGQFVAVGMTDASLAIIRLDLKAASGTVVKRISVDAGIGVGGSRSVKQVLFQPKPKRRKPPRSTTPLNIASTEVNEEMLADVDDIIGGKVFGRSATLDDDLFSPVKERNPQARYLAGKSASFHAPPAEREVAAPRSRSVQSITAQANSLDEPLRFQTTTRDRHPPPSGDTDWDDIFDDEVCDEEGLMEDSFKGITRRGSANSGNCLQQTVSEVPLTRNNADVTNSSRSYTRTSSSVEIRSHSKENWGGEKLVKSMSDVHVSSPHQNIDRKYIAQEGKGRTVRFDYLNDVMLGQPVLDMQKARESEKVSRPREEHIPESHDLYRVEEKPGEKSSVVHRAAARGNKEIPVPELASEVKDASVKNQPGITSDEIRDVVRQEVDVVRTDLRSDVLNIHTELITLATRQSQEIAAILKERDQAVRRLEEEVRRLHADNMRLRRKYGIG